MVKKYSKIADKVIVLISEPKKHIRKTKTGKAISAKISKKIFDFYIKKNKLKNVEVVISDLPSPLTATYEYIENIGSGTYILGSSNKNNDWKRWSRAKEYFAKHCPDVKILDPKKYAVEPYEYISASFIRDNIDNPKAIRKCFPKELTDKEYVSIISLLS